MLDSLKKWFDTVAGAPRAGAWRDMARWAEDGNFAFRHVREANGFVIDGRMGPTAWRLEWGPSQRVYVRGQELRLRADLHVPLELQALVLNRELQEMMEKDVFDQYVEDVQTRVDTQTPPEMRWLVMYPKLGGHEMKVLREHWAAVSNLKPWLERWLDGPLAAALRAHVPSEAAPLALMVSRGRLILRTAMPEPDATAVGRYLAMFQTALREAQSVASDFSDPVSPSTQPSLFAPSAMPCDATAH